MSNTVTSKHVIVIPMFRLGYSTLFDPRIETKDGKTKTTWDCIAMFDPNEIGLDMTIAGPDGGVYTGGLVALAYEALQLKEGNSAKFKDPPPPAVPKYRSPFRVGYEFKTPRPEYEGKIMSTLKSINKKPGIVFSDGKTTIENAQDLYPGCYCDAAVNAYCYNYQGSIGVTFGLRSIRKLKDGEPLVVTSNPEADFAAAPAKERYGIDNSSMFEAGKKNMIMNI